MEPIYALGLFFVRETGLIEQIVIFEYYDPDEEYRAILSDRVKYEEERSVLTKNMQYFLDQEDVRINETRVFPRVIDIEIGFRGEYTYPYITFIILFTGELKPGVNIYEDRYEPEEVEYDYRVYWFFPSRARVLKADLGVPYKLLDNGRILLFNVTKGSRIQGYERIEFELS